MRPRIVLVDDQRLARQGLKALLEGAGFDIAGETDDGRLAVKLIHKLRPDLMITDLRVFGLNGIELTRQVRQASLSTKVIVLSSYAEGQFVFSAFEAGANGYLLKKTSFDELVAGVRAVLNGQTYVAPVIADLVVRRSLGQATHTGYQQNSISTREREVLQLVAEGRSTKEIAAALYVSIKTIETHRKQIMDKLNVHSIAGLTKYAVRLGITPL
jgi:DNA-binding NarL/FixJ family response regulator